MSINFNAFEIARRALSAQQYGISVTGQNIANVNTAGYSRQRLALSESAPVSFSSTAVGTGVNIQRVQEFRDRFIESRLQTETGIAGRLTARRDSLAAVQTTLQGTATSGLNNALSGFFGAFRDLDANPSSTALRTVAAQKGAALATTFQTTRTRLDEIRHGADGDIRSTVETVNTISKQVAELNTQISAADSSGGNAAALRDQRGELVKQLSDLTGARSVENSDGTVTVTIGEGRALVTGDHVATLEAQNTPPLGLASLTIDGQPAVFEDGKIAGLQGAITETTKQIADLDGLAAQIVGRVNALHSSGTDADGNAGVNFFNSTAPVTAANISINAAITGNPRLIVASALPPPAQSGTMAGEMANLLTDQNTTVGTRTGSFSSIFGSMLADAGQQVATADSALQTQGLVLSQVTAQRDAVSGVSLDEEAINLLQYQKAYEAAARFMKIADEMTETILSLAQ